VLATGQPLVVEQVEQDPRFARDAAEATGYVPQAIMAVPLVAGGKPLGVLSVLDRRDRSRSALEEIELLGHFAEQAAIALDLLARARQAGVAATGPAARLAAAVDELEGARRRSAERLLESLAELLGPES
jgi:GAF domain-containing protein